VAAVLDLVALEHPGTLVPRSFIGWDKTGKLTLRTKSRDAIFRDRSIRYFRDNSIAAVFRVINKHKTERIADDAIRWINDITIGH